MAREIRVKFELNFAIAAINLPRLSMACGTVSRGVGFCPQCWLPVLGQSLSFPGSAWERNLEALPPWERNLEALPPFKGKAG
jgi:hypothetical protein